MTKVLELFVNRARRGRRRIGHPIACLAPVFGIAAVLTACTYDSDNPCGTNQVYHSESTTCVCAPGTVMVGKECVPCGVNEVAGASGCVCAAGYARASASGPCQAATSALGAVCDRLSNPCTDAGYAHCELASGAATGYCTSTGCASSADCLGGYACDTKVTPAICRRPPVGAGTTCTSAADCAGTEATYCDTYKSHACLVQGCTVSPNNCFEGTECCDLSPDGGPSAVCVPQGGCRQ